MSLVQAERSRFCIFAYVEKQTKNDRVVSSQKTDNISKSGNYPMVHFVFHNDLNDFARKNAVMELDLLPSEFREYLKNNAPTKWFIQAKPPRISENDRANLLYDTGAEIFTLDVALIVRKTAKSTRGNDMSAFELWNLYTFYGRPHSHRDHPKRLFG